MLKKILWGSCIPLLVDFMEAADCILQVVAYLFWSKPLIDESDPLAFRAQEVVPGLNF